MDDLFAIDAEARIAKLDSAARHTLRLERTRPILDQLKPQIEAAQAATLPASALPSSADSHPRLLGRRLTGIGTLVHSAFERPHTGSLGRSSVVPPPAGFALLLCLL